MQNGLGVAGGADGVPAGDEPLAQVPVVVDLPVEDDHLRAVFVEDRLATAAQVDDAESAHAEADGALYVQPLVVGPAVRYRGAHPPQQRFRHRALPLPVHDSRDAAHVA